MQSPPALHVDARDVIRLILQFLREHRLFHALRALQDETHVPLDAVDSVESLISDITNGRWDLVLQQTQTLSVAPAVLTDLYELVVLELLDAQEQDVADALLRQTPVLVAMKTTQPERFKRLEEGRGDILMKKAHGTSRQARRKEVAQMVRSAVSTVEPSRLLVLLGQALKWQEVQVGI